MVLRRLLMLTLEDPHRHLRLVILRRRVFLNLRDRNGRLLLDDDVHYVAAELYAKRERDQILQHKSVLLLLLTAEDAGHDRGAVGDALVRIQLCVGRLFEVVLDPLADPG